MFAQAAVLVLASASIVIASPLPVGTGPIKTCGEGSKAAPYTDDAYTCYTVDPKFGGGWQLCPVTTEGHRSLLCGQLGCYLESEYGCTDGNLWTKTTAPGAAPPTDVAVAPKPFASPIPGAESYGSLVPPPPTGTYPTAASGVAGPSELPSASVASALAPSGLPYGMNEMLGVAAPSGSAVAAYPSPTSALFGSAYAVDPSPASSSVLPELALPSSTASFTIAEASPSPLSFPTAGSYYSYGQQAAAVAPSEVPTAPGAYPSAASVAELPTPSAKPAAESYDVSALTSGAQYGHTGPQSGAGQYGSQLTGATSGTSMYGASGATQPYAAPGASSYGSSAAPASGASAYGSAAAPVPGASAYGSAAAPASGAAGKEAVME